MSDSWGVIAEKCPRIGAGTLNQFGANDGAGEAKSADPGRTDDMEV